MNTLTDNAVAAAHQNGQIVVRLASGAAIRFPVAENPRLARGTHRQLNRIEISPFGLHWPQLDEDLSFRGLLEGDHGQFQKKTRPDTRQSARRPVPGHEGEIVKRSGQIIKCEIKLET
jgi:hypothetical protein